MTDPPMVAKIHVPHDTNRLGLGVGTISKILAIPSLLKTLPRIWL